MHIMRSVSVHLGSRVSNHACESPPPEPQTPLYHTNTRLQDVDVGGLVNGGSWSGVMAWKDGVSGRGVWLEGRWGEVEGGVLQGRFVCVCDVLVVSSSLFVLISVLGLRVSIAQSLDRDAFGCVS